MERKQAQSVSCGILLVPVQILWTPAAATDCIAGSAGIYPCNKVNLLSHLDTSVFGTQGANDIWGWTDPASGTDYALLGLPNGVGFVDLSDPSNPVYLGSLPTQFVNSGWRDIKVFEDHAYIVSEGAFHGMQVFDLNRLTTVTTPPVTFSNDAHYNGFTNAHNIAINEDSGMAYAVGTNTCSGGLHAIDINNNMHRGQKTSISNPYNFCLDIGWQSINRNPLPGRYSDLSFQIF